MTSSNQQSILRSSNRTVISKNIDLDVEGFCSCFFCDKMPRDDMKASYSANKIGVKCRNCKINIVARSCSNQSRTCKNCVELCACNVCCDEPQWDKKEHIRGSTLWSSCIICKHSMICTACWEADRDTCGPCANSIVEEDRVYAEEEMEQVLVDLVDDQEEAVSAQLEAIGAQFNSYLEPDNSSFGLEAAINNGSGIVDRDAVYDGAPLTNSSSSSSIPIGDNMHGGTNNNTTVESGSTGRVHFAIQRANAAVSKKKKTATKKGTSASAAVLVQQSLHSMPLTLETLVRLPLPDHSTVVNNSGINSAAQVADRALGIGRSVVAPEEDDSESAVGNVQQRKRRRTSEVWAHGHECDVEDEVTGVKWKGMQCRHCNWITKYTSSTTGFITHLKYRCAPYAKWKQEQQETSTSMDDVVIDLDSPSLGKKSLSQLTTSTSAPSSVNQGKSKLQSVLFQSPDGSVGLQRGKDNAIQNNVVRGLINDLIAGGE